METTTREICSPDNSVQRNWTTKLKDYWILTKPEVNFLVVASTLAGFCIANRGPLHVALLLHTLVGTLFVASGTATLNQWAERDHDAQMRRTTYRPLPSGRLAAPHVLLFGVVISLIGAVHLWVAVNPLSSILAVSTLLSYLLIYTPLKRKTPICTFIGAFPGAMPPLIGWAAVRGNVAEQAWLLFGLVFLWQFPHFLAIAWLYRDDYARAGFRMLPKNDRRGVFTGYEVLVLTIGVIAVSLAPALLHYEGRVYLIGALILGAGLLFESTRLAMKRSSTLARHVLHASVIYLPVIFCLMVADKIAW